MNKRSRIKMFGLGMTSLIRLAAVVIALTVTIAAGIVYAAMPLAGTAIGNQASATYTDASQVQRTATSNNVLTYVAQVAALTMAADRAQNASPGSNVYYSHALTNTGNGNDSFSLAPGTSGGFTHTGVVFYADADGNGIPDNATPITTTGSVAPGAIFRFVIAASVPGTVANNDTGAITVTATSATDGSQSKTNTDTTTASTNAVITVTKAMSAQSGYSPTNGITVTLRYTNTGNSSATGVTLKDTIPAGMTYVPGSGRWSVSGATALTDAADSGVDPAGITFDYTSGVVTAVTATVPSAVSGTLTFHINVDSNLAAATVINNTATYNYNNGVANTVLFNTNTVGFTVLQVADLLMTGATVSSASQGSTVTFTNVVSNTGNGVDSFDITLGANTFLAGTSFVLYQSDGVTPLVDSNGNGIPDTGPLAVNATYNVVLRVFLTGSATGGPYTIQKTATSKFDPSKTVTVPDTLTTIAANTVDITDVKAAGVLGAIGEGGGASGDLASGTTGTTLPANAGATATFTVYVKNTSAVADNYDLSVKKNFAFDQSLPTGWSVSFFTSGNGTDCSSTGTLITNTGTVNAGSSKLVCAVVSVPGGYAAGTVDVWMKAASTNSGAADRIHNAVTVNTSHLLTIVPNNAGQVFPGGTVIYQHTIVNNGNIQENAIGLAIANDQALFSAQMYEDTNSDGSLNATDQLITSIASLDPGATKTIFVKIFSPLGATSGTQNRTTVTASNGSVSGTATDTTTVIAGQVRLQKFQAIDATCNGSADTAYSIADITSATAKPGACIRYQITATNEGAADVSAVVVSDATPAYTTYHDGTAGCSGSLGTAPAAAVTVGSVALATGSCGNSSTIQATIPTLTPGQSAVITFGVKINTQ